MEVFALQSGDENELKVLVMAINDQMGPDAEYFDFTYYQSIITETKDADRILELRAKAQEESPAAVGSGLGIAGAAAKSLLKSEILVPKVLQKLQPRLLASRRKDFSGMMDEFLDDIGVRDIQDEFTEIGNEFREEVGLKPKMTYAEKKELEELEAKQIKQEIQRQKNAMIQDRVAQQKAKIDAQRGRAAETATQSTGSSKLTVKEQMELLQQIKSLLDAGVLTQDEFEKRSKKF